MKDNSEEQSASKTKYGPLRRDILRMKFELTPTDVGSSNIFSL